MWVEEKMSIERVRKQRGQVLEQIISVKKTTKSSDRERTREKESQQEFKPLTNEEGQQGGLQ
jgi:hypothetical protein